MNQWLLVCALTGIETTTYVGALTRNETLNLIIKGMMLRPTELPSQGYYISSLNFNIFIYVLIYTLIYID